jgi:uncharacterized protein (DUF362 family)
VSRPGRRCHLHRSDKKSGSGGESLVVIRQHAEEDKFSLLEKALDQARFWERIEKVRAGTGLARERFSIIIKPDLEIFDPGAPTGTDPELVEHLILLLHKSGYPDVAVGDALGSADLWLNNRDVPVLADLVGYGYCTRDGGDYDVLNLSEDLEEAGFAEGSALCGSRLSRRWRKAHFRISMAKNKTDEALFFALGLKNILHVLPLRDKEFHYFNRLDAAEACMALLEKTPVHFAIIDAVVSNHGSDGIAAVNPVATNTVIAGDSLVLVDFAAAFKMGLDPYASPLNGKVLRAVGLPRRYGIDGDLSPYAGWKNVPLMLCDSVQRRNRSVAVAKAVRPWFQSVNRELFAFKNGIDERLNALAGTYLSRLDRHPTALLAKVALNYGLANAHHLTHAYRVMYAKERVVRRHTELGLDLGDYSRDDYEAIVDYIQPLARLLTHTAPDGNGLRWRYIDHSVLFEFSRTLAIAYEEFVSRVDIAAAVRLMNDNIGGACQVVARDGRGRITHQAERNIYLPQPNWMVLFNGDSIDVGKLELIRYERHCQQIFWRTVKSANNSALYDDGITTFAKEGKGHTRITITARQEFALPLFWQALNIDYAPAIKDAIVTDAYTRFFSRTMANYEAAYEGRKVGTGVEPDMGLGETAADPGGLPLEQAAELIFKIAAQVAPAVVQWVKGQGTSAKAIFGQLAKSQWVELAKSKYGDMLLTRLLQLMNLAFTSDASLRKNLANFDGRYLFKIEEEDYTLAAHFSEKGIVVDRSELEQTDVRISFRNAKVLGDFLLSPNPDILDAVLKQDVAIDGNLNYLLKFAFMAKKLQLLVTGGP